MRKTFLVSSILVILLVAGVVYVAHIEAENGKKNLGPVIPRFASVRSNEANLRTGPGTRYPIEWVFRRPGLPVEIIAKDDEDMWRRVRDSDGAEGWVHKSELSGKRTGVVTGGMRNLLGDKDDAAPVVAHVEAGAVGQILSCAGNWCRFKFDTVKGYLHKSDFWGAYLDEVID
jgi:SH3-like domain-containing protein